MKTFPFLRPPLLPLLVFGFVGVAAAQAPPRKGPAPPANPTPAPAPARAPLPAPQSISVMVVDYLYILTNSKAGKMATSQIEQKGKDYRNGLLSADKEIQGEQQTLMTEQDALQHQQSSLSADVYNKKVREFRQKVVDWEQKRKNLDRDYQSETATLQKSKNEAETKIREVMMDIIKGIATQRRVNLVLQKTDLILFDASFDVTDQVMQKLDEQLPVLTVNFAEPEPVPASAEPMPPPGRALTAKAKRK
jgi:outer membrane protein